MWYRISGYFHIDSLFNFRYFDHHFRTAKHIANHTIRKNIFQYSLLLELYLSREKMTQERLKIFSNFCKCVDPWKTRIYGILYKWFVLLNDTQSTFVPVFRRVDFCWRWDGFFRAWPLIISLWWTNIFIDGLFASTDTSACINVYIVFSNKHWPFYCCHVCFTWDVNNYGWKRTLYYVL